MLIVAALALLLAGPAVAAAGQEPPPAGSGIVVRVTVGLVQVDAVVTDKQGHPVTDLTPADFVVKEGGREREIMHLSYVRLAPPPARMRRSRRPGRKSPGVRGTLAP